MTPLEDLSLLRAFVCIVESGSISSAARTLKMPQPSLSRRLRMLEENCGVALLRRDTHRMSLTEAGHRLLADARALLALADEADAECLLRAPWRGERHPLGSAEASQGHALRSAGSFTAGCFLIKSGAASREGTLE